MKLVYSDPDETPAQIEKHISEFGYESGVLLDPTYSLVKLTGVEVTPEAAVFAPDGPTDAQSGSSAHRMVYRGRIDNRFVDFGKARPSATTHELRDALEAILEGRPIASPRTRAVGCFIPDLQ